MSLLSDSVLIEDLRLVSFAIIFGAESVDSGERFY